MRGRRPAALLVAAALAVPVSAAAPAWAHASFRTAQVDPGESLDAVLSVPVEVPDAENVRVVVDIPGGFVLSGCDGPFGWTCQRSDRQARFERVTGVANDSDFTLGLTAPREPGPYSFRTEQTLDNGDTETYDGDPFSETPAPVIVVRGEARNTATAPASPKPAGQQPARPAAAPQQGPAEQPSAQTAPASAPSATPVATARASAPAAQATQAVAAPEQPSGLTDDDRDEQAARADDGSNGGAPLAVLLLAGAVLVAAAAGVTASVRRRDLGSRP